MDRPTDSTIQSPGDEAGPMSLDEARRVPWLKDDGRPMGELVDSGFLTSGKLRQAADRATLPRIRLAAATLLSNLEAKADHPPVPENTVRVRPTRAPMSIDSARDVIWPFCEIRGRRIGALLDERALSLKDLAYAVESARDSVVRQAAATLLVDRVGKAEPPTGPMRVIKSERRSYSEYRQLQIVLTEGALLGLGVAAVIIGAIWWLVTYLPVWLNPATRSTFLTPIGIAAIAIAGVFGLMLGNLAKAAIERASKEFDTSFDNHRKGQLGEEQAVEHLRAHFDGAWTLYRNVVLPGRKGGDLDAVLVGPNGVWVLEIKNYSGSYRNRRNRWEWLTSKGWTRIRTDPSAQANRNAQTLRHFFEADHINQYVHAAVVWVQSDSLVEVVDSDTPVWRLDLLKEPLEVVRNKARLEAEVLAKIEAKLERLTMADPEAS